MVLSPLAEGPGPGSRAYLDPKYIEKAAGDLGLAPRPIKCTWKPPPCGWGKRDRPILFRMGMAERQAHLHPCTRIVMQYPSARKSDIANAVELAFVSAPWQRTGIRSA